MKKHLEENKMNYKSKKDLEIASINLKEVYIDYIFRSNSPIEINYG